MLAAWPIADPPAQDRRSCCSRRRTRIPQHRRPYHPDDVERPSLRPARAWAPRSVAVHGVATDRTRSECVQYRVVGKVDRSPRDRISLVRPGEGDPAAILLATCSSSPWAARVLRSARPGPGPAWVRPTTGTDARTGRERGPGRRRCRVLRRDQRQERHDQRRHQRRRHRSPPRTPARSPRPRGRR